MTSKAWLDALLDDGPLPEHTADAPSALIQIARLQRAFAGLSPTAGDLPEPEEDAACTEAVLFHWDGLAVLEELGSGGFGTVYRARDPMLQREVALKLRAAGGQVSEAAERAFIGEARRLARVRHPNVLAVHGTAIAEGRAGIWTDLIHGQTLAARVAERGPLPAAELLHLLASTGCALVAVHAQAIVHGDLKPANVMWESAGDRVVLMDFGAGRRLDADGRTVLRAGSPSFMAPEQRTGMALGTAADLYALGATALFAATGVPPQQPGALAALDARRDLSRRTRLLLKQLLEPVPENRPTAEQVVARCHELATEPERLRRRRRRAAILAVLLLAVLATGTALLLALRARAEVEAERNRAVATRDFLLGVLRSPNPYQTDAPTRTLEQLFEQAVAQLPQALPNDPQTAARLLQQFGRSLIILDRDAPAIAALERADQLLELSGSFRGEPLRIDVRSYLSDVYRRQRQYAKARALVDEQAALCSATARPALTPRTCVAIVNDQIEVHGFGGDPQRALELTEENLTRARAAGLLEGDYEAVFTLYLRGVMQSELGRADAAADSFIELTERTLRVAPATHPGLLTDLMLLAGSADALGDPVLAAALHQHAWSGRVALYGEQSRYSVQVAVQGVQLALRGGRSTDARTQARDLLSVLPAAAFAEPFRDQLLLLSALADDERVSDAELDALGARAAGTHDAGSAVLADHRLQLAAIALRRDQRTRAQHWLALARPVVAARQGAGLRSLLAVLDAHVAGVAPAPPDRRVFDPITRRWLGPLPAGAAARLQTIRQLKRQVLERRASAAP